MISRFKGKNLLRTLRTLTNLTNLTNLLRIARYIDLKPYQELDIRYTSRQQCASVLKVFIMIKKTWRTFGNGSILPKTGDNEFLAIAQD